MEGVVSSEVERGGSTRGGDSSSDGRRSGIKRETRPEAETEHLRFFPTPFRLFSQHESSHEGFGKFS